MIIPEFIFFGILAAFFLALANVLDKTVLTNHITDPVIVTFFTGIFGAIYAFILPLLGYVGFLSTLVFLGSLLTGAGFILGIYLYMKSLTIEEVSRVVPIISLSPVFVVILSAMFLNEILTLTKYIGVFLAIIGSIIVSSKKFGKEFFHLKANRAFWLPTTGAILFAGQLVASKWLLNFADYWNIFFWTRIGALIPITGLLIYEKKRNTVFSMISDLRNSKIEFMGAAELFSNIAILLQTLALSLGPATLVQTVTSAQSLFVLFIVGGMKHIWDRDIGENLSRKAVAIKTVSTLMIIIGIYLIK